MPIEILYADDMTVEYLCTGAITGGDIIKANQMVMDSGRLPGIIYKILNRTDCSSYEVSAEDVRSISVQEELAAKINADRVVLIISKTPVQYGMGRMYQSYIARHGFHTEFFDSKAAADEWISNHRLKQTGSSSS